MNLYITISAILAFCIGIIGFIIKKNLIMKIICINVINSSTITFCLGMVHKQNYRAPILNHTITSYADPLPQALVITAIVVNFGILSLSLIFTMLLVNRYHTLDVRKIRRDVQNDFLSGDEE